MVSAHATKQRSRQGRTRPSDELNAYIVVAHAQPHPDRARTIMQDHPEVRALFGPNPWSALCLVGIVLLQLALALLIVHVPWWAMLLAAYFVGAILTHAMWVLVHECTHNLIFRSPTANRLLALFANLAIVFPMTVAFSIYHLKHHKFLGDYNHDADIAPRWEAWLLRRGFWGRLAWSCLFPILQTVRTLYVSRAHRPRSWTRWLWPNIVIQILFCAVWLAFFGRRGLAYLMCSAYFSTGAHPFVARYVQEHYVFRGAQETYSYYGLSNLFAFNIGYHNEHHDLPQVPWNRLPALKRLAPEMYDHLYAHHSWLRLWLRFLFDRELDVMRIARHE
jgi:sphingolipid delta-4 desaturase